MTGFQLPTDLFFATENHSKHLENPYSSRKTEPLDTKIPRVSRLCLSFRLTSKGHNPCTFFGDFSCWTAIDYGRKGMNIIDDSWFNMSTHPAPETNSANHCDFKDTLFFCYLLISPNMRNISSRNTNFLTQTRRFSRVFHQVTRRYRARCQRYVQRPSADMDGRKEQHHSGQNKMKNSQI